MAAGVEGSGKKKAINNLEKHRSYTNTTQIHCADSHLLTKSICYA